MDKSLTSVIAGSAVIGKNTVIGDHCVIQDNVSIGDDCTLANSVIVYSGSKIGSNVQIYDHSIIGRPPISSKRSVKRKKTDDNKPAQIASDVRIGSHAVIYNQTVIQSGVMVADTAAIRERVIIGKQTIVGRLVTIENDTRIGIKCKLETGCYITAYSEIGDGCFVAPMVKTSNDNFIGRTEERFKHFKGLTLRNGGRIGVGAVILPGIEIGEEAVVAAGAVVTRNVPPKTVVMGIPAKKVKNVPPEEWFENQ